MKQDKYLKITGVIVAVVLLIANVIFIKNKISK